MSSNTSNNPLASLSLDELLIDVRDHERSRPDKAAAELRRRFQVLEQEKAEAHAVRRRAVENAGDMMTEIDALRIVAVRERDEARGALERVQLSNNALMRHRATIRGVIERAESAERDLAAAVEARQMIADSGDRVSAILPPGSVVLSAAQVEQVRAERDRRDVQTYGERDFVNEGWAEALDWVLALLDAEEKR